MCDQGLNMMGQATAGTVKVLAIAQKTRFPGLPDVPTTAEAGLPGFEVSAATAMYVPAGTPAAATAKLVATMAAAYKDAGVRKRIQDLASEIPGPGQDTPAALGAFTKSEMERLTAAISSIMACSPLSAFTAFATQPRVWSSSNCSPTASSADWIAATWVNTSTQ